MPSVRQKSVWKVAIGAVGTPLAFLVIFWLYRIETASILKRIVILVAAVPVGIGFAGLLEWLTGRPFMELSQSWDELKGWQRGAIGSCAILLVIAAFTAIAWLALA